MRKILIATWLAALSAAPALAEGEKNFKTPQLAVKAFSQALVKKDQNGMRAIFGPRLKGLLASEERDEAMRVLGRVIQEHWSLAPTEEGGRILRLGAEGWPFPVPLAKGPAGWHFDTTSGLEEILNRRVGHNELLTISTLHRLIAAEKAYQAREKTYATRILSTPGKHDGLYWKSTSKTDRSPLENALGHAFKYAEGHVEGAPWFGYRYQIRPGPGFEVIAYPVNYGKSGVMSFVCNQEGVIYQKDLGAKTYNVIKTLESFAPDDSWTQVNEKQ
ncbi:MAG: DUF2950 family protein [Candidatus Eremiobacteraeota bacterium]|nr:DUF2950 family protein [Candidatus Eremiobacteraeota bacterium]MCW5865895.1 DUF2950 family protein [Candidatus Eremiobacteraeota bacterium]